MKMIEKKIKLGGRELALSTGEYAEQADGSILATYGDTVVLALVTVGKETDRDYFPLSVDYQERLYAGGRIKGSRWVKRGGRPADELILTSRLIDRSIRPLFPSDFRREVQVVITVLSVDLENDPVDIAPIAVSAAIEASSLPWEGPVSVLRVGTKEGKQVINLTHEDKKTSELDLIVSSTKKAVVMIEGFAQEVSEENILKGIALAHKESAKVLKVIGELAKEVGKEKLVIEEVQVNEKLKKQVEKLEAGKIAGFIKEHGGTKEVFAKFFELKDSVMAEVEEENSEEAGAIMEKIFKTNVRDIILSGKRVDGRKHSDIRELTSKVGVLPRTHGSGMFKRGSTQALTVATLGSPSLGLLLESAEGESEKNYIHHYTMPPFATGETGRVGFTNRREIGHGALAERALLPVIPSQEDFPYTILLMSEVLSSNGSSSMASTCGSSLALMDAGVPISSPVSGIAMGIVLESDKKYAILSDIMGIEDFNGDMDFKVTGTAKGITAMQMDVKSLALTPAVLEEALMQAKEGRAIILKNMLATIKESRKEISKYAPKVSSISIDPEKIGTIIGPGGKTIKALAADTGAEINVDDDGTINVSGVDSAGVDKAIETIANMVKEVEPGEIYEGEVKRIESYGAFVEVLPGKDGLVHVSDMSEGFVADANDKVNIGDKVQVRVKEVDNMGRINLSFLLDPASDEKKEEKKNERRYTDKHAGGKRNFGNRRDNNRGGGRGRNNFSANRNSRNDRQDRKSGGPHFPKSRLAASNKKDRR